MAPEENFWYEASQTTKIVFIFPIKTYTSALSTHKRKKIKLYVVK